MEVIGVGGTVRNLAKVHQRASSYPLPKLHNYNLPVEDLFALVKSICSKTYEERQKISGLSEERADIIIAGALMVQEIVRKAKSSYLTIPAAASGKAFSSTTMIPFTTGKAAGSTTCSFPP